jgi:cytochrome c-type biogenesis protein CcmH/NrfG
MLWAEMGEAYLMQGNKEKSFEVFKRAAALEPDNPNGKYLIENFDAVYEQIHPKMK